MDSQKIDPVEAIFEKKLKRKLENSEADIAKVARPRKKQILEAKKPQVIHGFVPFRTQTSAETKQIKKVCHEFIWRTVL